MASDLEPVLDWDDIQGNILGGFNKDHQTILGLSFGNDAANAKRFLSGVIGMITPLRDVVLYKGFRRQRMIAEGVEPSDMSATWVAIAFSFDGLKVLSSSADGFVDSEFRVGLPGSSSRLGDPTGGYATWVTGAPGNIPDLFVIVGADRDADAKKTVNDLRSKASASGLIETYHEEGHDVSYFSRAGKTFEKGHEHFGFKDGVSQPGVRGTLPNQSFLTPRIPSEDDDNGPEMASPGKPLICVGQFILGFAQQLDAFPRQAGPKHLLGTMPGAIAPEWARNGSFLIFRRLRQNVPAFRKFIASVANHLGHQEMGPGRVAAMVVGRWPSGAPIIRTPLVDDHDQAKESVINSFAYGSDNEAMNLPNDTGADICPVAAHIRKVNPRDQDTDQGSASATLLRRILRRGIPYGPPLAVDEDDSSPVDRGLLFLSYQSSISQQFEFLCSQWMNSAILPTNPNAVAEGAGFDILLGQNSAAGRNRFAYLFDGTTQQRISSDSFTPKDWVVATGGGYFFAPSISAIRTVLAR